MKPYASVCVAATALSHHRPASAPVQSAARRETVAVRPCDSAATGSSAARARRAKTDRILSQDSDCSLPFPLVTCP
eukprot:6305104-Prymnesium_polylepis.1